LYMCACMYLCVGCDQVSFILVSCSVICFHDDCYHGLAKGVLPEVYSIHKFDEQYLGGH